MVRKALGENSKGRTLAGAIVMARKETKTDVFPPVLVQLLGLLFCLCRTLNILLAFCWSQFLPVSHSKTWDNFSPNHVPNTHQMVCFL